jgi:hypothetical protein
MIAIGSLAQPGCCRQRSRNAQPSAPDWGQVHQNGSWSLVGEQLQGFIGATAVCTVNLASSSTSVMACGLAQS